MPLDTLNFKGKFGDLCVALFLLYETSGYAPAKKLQLKKKELSPGLNRVIFLASSDLTEIDSLGEVDPVPAHDLADVMSPVAVAAPVQTGAVVIAKAGGDFVQLVIHRRVSLP